MKTSVRRIAFACSAALALLVPAVANGQTIDDSGQWLAFFGNGKLHVGECPHRLRWWFDGHARFFDDTGGFGQSIVRPGIGYALEDSSAVIWAGYGWIRTSPATSPDFDEHRIWQQVTWSRKTPRANIGFRSRLEQRFVETGSDTGWRFRQLVSLRRPLEHAPRITLVVWDEVFLHLNDTNWGADAGFDQNRIFVGLGFKLRRDSPFRLEVGYMNQYVGRGPAADLSNHIVSVNLFWNP